MKEPIYETWLVRDSAGDAPLYGVWSASRRVWYWANSEPLLYDDRRAAMALLCHAKAVAEQGTAYSRNDWECRLVGMDGLPVDEGAQ